MRIGLFDSNLRCVLKCEKFGSHFLCQSLLLGTNMPNDNTLVNANIRAPLKSSFL